MNIYLNKDESAEYLNRGREPAMIGAKICAVWFIGWIITILITGRVIASLFWPIWLVLVLRG